MAGVRLLVLLVLLAAGCAHPGVAWCATGECAVSYDGERFSCADEYLLFAPEPLRPGDEAATRLTVSNESDADQAIGLLCQAGDAQSASPSLLEQAELRIETPAGKTLYAGSVESESLSRGIDLGTIAASGSAEFFMTVSLPETMDNRYALDIQSLTWTFSAMRTTKAGAGAPFAQTGIDPTLATWFILALFLATVTGVAGAILWRTDGRSNPEKPKEVQP